MDKVENKEKYMFQAMDVLHENISSFMHDCWDDVEKVGTDFHADAEKMSFAEAIKDLDVMVDNFKQEYLAGEKIEATTIMDIVIAAAIAFKKVNE